MFDLKKLCYFLVAINVLVIFFNLTFIRNVDPQQEIEVMGSSENKGPNIDIDISKSAIKPKPIDKNAPYISVDFEITGKVQGVYFRKYTEQKATELGLVGWVMNTPSGSVEGLMQGPPAKIEEMKNWLCETGSPTSKIDKCNFTNEEGKESLTYKKFIVMK